MQAASKTVELLNLVNLSFCDVSKNVAIKWAVDAVGYRFIFAVMCFDLFLYWPLVNLVPQLPGVQWRNCGDVQTQGDPVVMSSDVVGSSLQDGAPQRFKLRCCIDKDAESVWYAHVSGTQSGKAWLSKWPQTLWVVFTGRNSVLAPILKWPYFKHNKKPTKNQQKCGTSKNQTKHSSGTATARFFFRLAARLAIRDWWWGTWRRGSRSTAVLSTKPTMRKSTNVLKQQERKSSRRGPTVGRINLCEFEILHKINL